MELTYYGHSCFLVDLKGTRILFDPFISPNPLAAHIDVLNIECDYVVISHAHEDHTADAELILKNTNAKLIANYEIVEYYKRKGIKITHAMNIGGKFDFEFGTVKMVNAVHSSSFPDGTYGGTAGGYVISTPEATFYFAGDTALNQSMKLISAFNQIDFALMPIGGNFTMDVTEALMAADFVQTDKIIGLHYDTFPEIAIDKDEAAILAEGSQKELILLDIEETLSIV